MLKDGNDVGLGLKHLLLSADIHLVVLHFKAINDCADIELKLGLGEVLLK